MLINTYTQSVCETGILVLFSFMSIDITHCCCRLKRPVLTRATSSIHCLPTNLNTPNLGVSCG